MYRTPDRERFLRHMVIRDYTIIGVLATTTITALLFNLLASTTFLFFGFYALIGALIYSFLISLSDAKHPIPRDKYGRAEK